MCTPFFSSEMCRYFLHIFRTVCWDGDVWGQSNFPLLNAYYSIKLYLIYKFSNLIKTPGSGQFSMFYYISLSHWLQLKSLDRETKAGYFWNVNNGRQNRDRQVKKLQNKWYKVKFTVCFSPPLTLSFDMRASWIENSATKYRPGKRKQRKPLFLVALLGKGASRQCVGILSLPFFLSPFPSFLLSFFLSFGSLFNCLFVYLIFWSYLPKMSSVMMAVTV